MESVASLVRFAGRDWTFPVFHVLLPAGISFYTFSSMTYSIDVYRGKQAPEQNLLRFATYIAFFPKIVAGPIDRATHFLPQLVRPAPFNAATVTAGLRLMLWGFFVKVVIADRLSSVVAHVYGNPSAFPAAGLLLATVFFAFQIYCDFSGYSDIARGAARVLGYDLMLNFDSPYFAKSVAEFWRRWHISLSTWFKDYLYIPLGGNRVSRPRWYFNLFFVFLVSGLWHGASWTFVIWGALHGFYLLAEIVCQPVTDRLSGVAGRVLPAWVNGLGAAAWTYARVLLAWIFFRANSFADAFHVCRGILLDFPCWLWHFASGTAHGGATPRATLADALMGQPPTLVALCLGLIVLLLACEGICRPTDVMTRVAGLPRGARWLVYYLLCTGIVFLGSFGRHEFIYQQF